MAWLPSRVRTQLGFTLVELLVVVAIVALLIAMLIPAIGEARFLGVRAVCLSDRRQNMISVSTFASERGDRAPNATAGDCSGGVAGPGWDDLSPYPHSHPNSYKGGQWEGSVKTNECMRVHSWGTLIRFDYIRHPYALYCPAFVRDKAGNEYFMDEQPDVWAEMTDGDERMGAFRRKLGVSHYFYASYNSAGTKPIEHMRIADYADDWRDTSIEVSPMLVSCANYDTDDRYSHDLRGVNGAFYDGSARWVSVSEVQAAGRQGLSYTFRHWLDNREPINRYSNLQPWARRHATLTAP